MKKKRIGYQNGKFTDEFTERGENKILLYREYIEKAYQEQQFGFKGGFDEILCYELHSNPVNPRLHVFETGLTFKELAQKWGVSVSFLGELIADHCKKLEDERIDIDPSQKWFWTKKWQLGEKMVDEELASGEYTDFSSVDELFSRL